MDSRRLSADYRTTGGGGADAGWEREEAGLGALVKAMGSRNGPCSATGLPGADRSSNSAWTQATTAAPDQRPRRELDNARVISTSANPPTSWLGPAKFTTRLFSVRPASSPGSRREGPVTSKIGRAHV